MFGLACFAFEGWIYEMKKKFWKKKKKKGRKFEKNYKFESKL